MRPTEMNVSGSIEMKPLPDGGRLIEISPEGGGSISPAWSLRKVSILCWS
ncbi:hypothetical protein GNP92_03400 [Paenibacillus timonensis]|nr:hypothetical protein [Paenibacillus timonensis]MUG85393.1 hypothetical protein [Paenibacillus timonensis]